MKHFVRKLLENITSTRKFEESARWQSSSFLKAKLIPDAPNILIDFYILQTVTTQLSWFAEINITR